MEHCGDGRVMRDEVTWMSDEGVTDLGFAGSICWLIFPYLYTYIAFYFSIKEL